MIGGHDVILKADSDMALDVVCDVARRVWPDCVMENSDTGVVIPKRFYSYDLSDLGEIMVFKNQEARELWRTNGATPETEDTMVYALVDSGELTLAVCEPNRGDAKTIVAAVRQLLSNMPAALEASRD